MLSTVRRVIHTKYLGILYVEHWEDLFTQNTEEYCMLALWEDLFTQNTEEYCMLSTVGRFIYTKY